MHGVLALAEILFFPSDGAGDGLVADELLDWVNTIDPAPSNDEGADLLALASPWDSDAFFPYLSRCVLRGHLAAAAALLSLVEAQHPDDTLQRLAKHLSALVAAYPRSTAFRTESAFLAALHQWRTQTLAPLKREIDPLLASDAAADWAPSLEPLVALVSASDPPSAQSAIAALGAEDWRESLAAHALWAAPTTLRRTELPPLVDALTRAQPVDASLAAERAHAALLRADVPAVLKALTGSYAWAAAHLGDLLAHLHLAAFDPPALRGEDDDAALGLGLREAFLLDWGDRCTADAGLWRVSCEYWAACGKPGRDKVRALAVGLPLEAEGEGEAPQQGARGDGMDVEGAGEGEGEGEGDKDKEKENAAPKKRQVDELLAVLAALDLTDEFTATCEAYAARLVERKRFGEAVAYAVRAADGRRIAEIADRILDEYIENGASLSSFLSVSLGQRADAVSACRSGRLHRARRLDPDLAPAPSLFRPSLALFALRPPRPLALGRTRTLHGPPHVPRAVPRLLRPVRERRSPRGGPAPRPPPHERRRAQTLLGRHAPRLGASPRRCVLSLSLSCLARVESAPRAELS